MYNLSYTYIKDLDIDTSTSYRDISALAVFVEYESEDYHAPLSSLTDKFVNWFFDTDNEDSSKLNIIFKDVTLSGDAITPKTNDSLISYDMLSNHLSSYLEEIKDNLINHFRVVRKTLNPNMVIPKGSVIINDSDWDEDEGKWGEWKKIDNRFISEATPNKLAGEKDIGDFDDGEGEEANNLEKIIISTNKMPEHNHEVILSPASKNAVGKLEDSVTGLGKFNFNGIIAIADDNKNDYTIYFAKDGYDGEQENEYKIKPALAKLENAYSNYLSVSETGPKVNISKKIKIAPNIKPLENQSIFVKIENVGEED